MILLSYVLYQVTNTFLVQILRRHGSLCFLRLKSVNIEGIFHSALKMPFLHLPHFINFDQIRNTLI